MIRQRLCLLMAVVFTLAMLTACSSNDTSKASNGVGTAYPDKTVGFQLEPPTEGDKVAIMHTSMGDISIRLFPEAAPKAVQNFITHAQNGYYNGVTFHRVMEDFMIQGGDPDGTGRGGESIWKEDFEDEFDTRLLNLRGSLAMANAGVNTNGSQFFINQGSAESFANMIQAVQKQFTTYESQWVAYNIHTWQELYAATIQQNTNAALNLSDIPEAVWDLYKANGGSLYLDGAWRASGGHTVFGQVYDGMDVVDAIAAVKVNAENSRPLQDVTIESIEIRTYTK